MEAKPLAPGWRSPVIIVYTNNSLLLLLFLLLLLLLQAVPRVVVSLALLPLLTTLGLKQRLGRRQREGSAIIHSPSTKILPASFVCPSPAGHIPESGRGAMTPGPWEMVEVGRGPQSAQPVQGGPHFTSTG